MPDRRLCRSLSLLAFGALCQAGVPAWAQSAGRSFSVTPAFSASETYTETRASPTIPSGGEFVTRLSPGITVASRSGRVQGSLNYALNALFRSGSADAREIQNSLNAAFTAEAVERWLFVDARATISQQSLSAQGLQTLADSTQANANRAEVGTASLSPYVRGMLGGVANYEARLELSANEVKGSSTADSVTTGGSLSLSSATQGRLGWGLSLTQQDVDYKVGRQTTSGRANLSLSYRVDHDLQLSVNGGRESTDVGAADRQNQTNWGAGLTWTPTPRTSLRLQSDRRYFGRSHSWALSHRMQRSSFTYTDTRDATGGGDPQGVGQSRTRYQVLLEQYRFIEPDEVARDLLVRELLRQQPELDPNEQVPGGVLSSAVSLQRRQDLAFAWTGLRAALNLQGFASNSRMLDVTAANPDDGGTRLRGYNGSLSYRLTPLSTISLTGSRQVTSANLLGTGNKLRAATLSWTTQPARRISTSLSARYTVFNSDTSPYRETSLTATANLRF